MALDVDALYRRYGGMVYRRCFRLLQDEARASDAMQDVFVQVLRHEASLNAQAPSSMLFRIATNVSLNLLRGSSRKPEDRDQALLLRIADSADLEDHSTARLMLRRIFGQEQESTRTLAVLHLLDGMTLEEVAAEVGLSVSGVRKRLRTLRERVVELESL